MEPSEYTPTEKVFNAMKEAFELMKTLEPSRELSLAQTQLETAVMWFNKHRTIKEEFKPIETFIKR